MCCISYGTVSAHPWLFMEQAAHDILQEVMAVLKEQHPPVEHWPEAEHFMSTDEVMDLVMGFHHIDDLGIDALYAALKDAGYKVGGPPGDVQVGWMMG